MAQLFPKGSNQFAKVVIVLGLVTVVALFGILAMIDRSPYVTRVGLARKQPVPFSHKHHVGAIGIDCRYCHTSVEESSFAGMPSTETCMNCHSILYSESEMLEPVRESFRTGKSLEWIRVTDLPDYVYFNHSIHVAKGIGCTTCHGQVDQMPLMKKSMPFHMKDCVDCHREPEKFLRPMDEVFNVHWQPGKNQLEEGREMLKKRGIENQVNCSICHR